MIRALLWKEWREQRWRMLLSVFVLATISASLVRAQIIPTPEAMMLSFGILGLILTIFLSMGSVATERQDHTWSFLIAQPVSRATLLDVKWAMGATNLLAALLAAGLAVTWAAWSRGLFSESLPPYQMVTVTSSLFASSPNSAAWIWRVVGLSAVALLSLYTVLFFILTRATNELHAGLGGLLATIAILAWLAEYSVAHSYDGRAGEWWQHVFWWMAFFNPLSPLAFVYERPAYQAIVVCVSFGLWTVVPLALTSIRITPRYD